MGAVDGRTALGLTPAQQGIWMGQQMAMSSPRYNTAECIRIEGRVDLQRLAGCVEAVFNGADGLNVRFSVAQPLQEIVPLTQRRCSIIKHHFSLLEDPSVGSVSALQVNASTALPTELPTEISQWVSDQLRNPLNIGNGELYQLALLTTDQNSCYLFIKIHHIAIDGFGFSLLIDTILKNYEGRHLPEPLFGDYRTAVLEAKNQVELPQYQETEHYWRAHLSGHQPPHSFSASKGEYDETFIRARQRLPTHTYRQLQQAARDAGVTWPDLILSALTLLLCRHTGCSHQVLGLPLMSRMGSCSVNVPMMAMNITPLVAQMAAGDSVLSCAKNIAEQFKRDRPFHHYRYEALRALARKDKWMAGENVWGPVVNIMPFTRRATLGGLNLSYINLSAGPVEDISFAFSVNADQSLALTVDANPNRYTQSLLHQVAEELVAELTSDISELSQPVKFDPVPLSWMAAEQFPKQNLADSDLNFWLRVKNISQLSPSQPAIEHKGQCVSYAELVKKVERFSAQLEKIQIGDGARCALVLPRGVNAIVASLACVALRATFIFVDCGAPKKRNRIILEDAQVDLILADVSEAVNDYGDIADVMVVQNSKITARASFAQGGKIINHHRFSQGDTCYIVYTSGSSGRPKGVAIGYEAAQQFVSAAVRHYGFLANDRVLQFAPLHFDACIEEIFCTLSVGGTLVIRTDDMLDSTHTFLSLCQKWRVTLLDLPTAYWHELVAAMESQSLVFPKAINTVILGGEAVKREVILAWQKRIEGHVQLFNSYGPTEATVVATVEPLHKYSEKQTDVAIGGPLHGRALAVVDARMRVLPRGESGELVLAGAGLAQGYIGSKVTQAPFIHVYLPWCEQPLRGYRTGDRVVLTGDNRLVYLGRVDNEIKVSGHRIAPQEIEVALENLTGIQQAVVTAQKFSTGVHIVAHLIACEGSELRDLVALREALAQTLPQVMLPKSMHYVEAYPLTGSGKVDRKKLSKSSKKNDQLIQGNDEFSQMRELWTQLLGAQEYQADDNFFNLGGESIQVIQLANKLSQITGAPVNGTLLFQNPTLEAMSRAALGGKRGEENAVLSHDRAKQQVIADCEKFEQRLKAQINVPAGNTLRPMGNVLVTGATGFVGVHMVMALLSHTPGRIFCFIRADSNDAALERFYGACREFHVSLSQSEKADLSHRLVVFAADISKPSFGMVNNQEQAIFSQVSHIFHVAAVISVTRDYSSLAKANTLATGELLLAAARYGIAFQHCSTVAVTPPKNQGNLTEDFVAYHEGLLDGYQQSKWAAENLVERAVQNGVDARLFRLGRITGRFSNGFVKGNDLVWQILSLGLKHQVLPDLNVEEPWTPVNEVVDIMLTACASEGFGRVVNLVGEHRVGFKKMFQWLREEGYGFDVVSVPEWCQTLSQSEGESELALVAFFHHKKQAAERGVDLQMGDMLSGDTCVELGRLNKPFSRITREHFQKYCQFALEEPAYAE